MNTPILLYKTFYITNILILAAEIPVVALLVLQLVAVACPITRFLLSPDLYFHFAGLLLIID